MSDLLPTGERLLRAGTLDSTNEEARRRARMGERGPLWILADRQTSGRGRRGRAWLSEPGNLFTTLLFSPGGRPAERARLSFMAALAVHDALSFFIPPSRRGESRAEGGTLQLKWPNDVLVGERKIAGILLEAEEDWVAAGFGVNLARTPQAVDRPATSLFDSFDAKVTPAGFLGELAVHFDRWRRADFADVRNAWLDRATGVGAPIEVRLSGRVHRGRFIDLAADGALLLEAGNGSIERITAGDVFFASREG